MSRQTDFTLEQLRQMLKGKGPKAQYHGDGAKCRRLASGLPEGLIYNEIGLIFLEGGKDAEAAKEDLLAMLVDTENTEIKRAMAYYYFMRAEILTLATQVHLEAFKENKQNAKIIELATAALSARP